MSTSTNSGRRVRVRAPELAGRGWLGTGGRPLSLAGLRGKIVLLDFWTFCCVNCLHVLDELKPLEERYRDVLVTIGVHSPKFEHEADADALAAAVERYGVDHAVLDDPELTTWKAYAARAWPTLTVVDPEGYVVAQMSGEGHAHGLSVLIEELVAEHEAKGTLHRGDGPYVPPEPPSTALRFPGKVLALPVGTFLVSDTAHHQLVELEADLVTEVRRLGDGRRGLVDGGPQARFSEPQGLALLPADVAARVGYDVVVADSVNHALRGVRLADGSVSTVAGTGVQLRQRSGGGPAGEQPLSTPWDVAWFDDRVVVAMAGTHQLWELDPVAGRIGVLAGTSGEGIRDGAAHHAWFAPPSGLAGSPHRNTLWIADSETSALRHVRRRDVEGARYEVLTDVGTGLFDFGHVDGPAADALLQHPLGVTVLPDGSVAVSDTYNGAVRRFDPVRREVTTLARGLAEPSAAVVELLVDGAGTDHGLSRSLWLDAGVGHGVLHVSVQAASCDGDPETGEVPEFAACHLYQQDWGIPVRLADGGERSLTLDLRGA